MRRWGCLLQLLVEALKVFHVWVKARMGFLVEPERYENWQALKLKEPEHSEMELG